EFRLLIQNSKFKTHNSSLRKFYFSRFDIFYMRLLRLDPHSVERAPDEEERDEEESTGQIMRQGRVAVVTFGETHSQLNSQKTEQRRELDDRVERDGRRILER